MTPSLELAALLLVVGLFIYALELFLPSAGLLFFAGTVCVVGAVVVAFLVSWVMGSVALIVVAALAAVLPTVGLEIWKRSPIGRRMFLDSPIGTSDPAGNESLPGEAGAAVLPESSNEWLQGQVGRTVTPHRPVGKSEFNGRRFDTVAEGIIIDRGEYVRVVSVQGNRVVVRKLAPEEMNAIPPSIGNLDDALDRWTLENDM